ncbi:cytosine deaminase [Longilinea arvoryzae]|uniref:Cytosine deaminase n=1 Tax=Longilinea arvoryzae TaxID=360412 RepID=A0A0S7BG00_9CHLR|nr:amidohydrolase [Longilinea arvoryzae]GAP14509.1 cytosine deaminase [Longilinea arvoryzae]
MIDILIKNCMLITVNSKREVYHDGAIAIDQGKIVDIGSTADVAPKYEARTVIDAKGFVVMPGLINAHMHLPQVMMRGLYDNIEAMDKLKNYTWPIQGCYTEEDALVSAKLGLLEMIKSGTTAFISTGLHPRYGIPAVIQATIDSGMRAAISKYVMDLGGYALDNGALHKGMHETGEASKKQALELIEEWNGCGNGRIQIWISPRSVGGCSVDLFRWVCETAREHQVGITTHWSEVQNNVDYTMDSFGLRPVFFAKSLGLLGPDVTFAHGIYFDDAEIDLLAKTGTNIAHCPICNSKLAMGVARVPEMLKAGVNISLGNDGMGVNNTADLFREMRSMVLLHRAVQNNPLFPGSAEAIEMATRNGARAMMMQDRVGSLEKGKQADLILVDLKQPHFVPIHDPVSEVVWAANGNDVDTVIIDGKIVMWHRTVLTMDEDAILGEAEAIKDKILKQAGVKAQHIWAIR